MIHLKRQVTTSHYQPSQCPKQWKCVMNKHLCSSLNQPLHSLVSGAYVKCTHSTWQRQSPLSTKSRWSPPPFSSICNRISYHDSTAQICLQPHQDYCIHCTSVLPGDLCSVNSNGQINYTAVAFYLLYFLLCTKCAIGKL